VKILIAFRQLGANQAAGAKSMERLSSGLRINRAGDDAAGLAISEKMRGQIRGLKQATRNSQDAISMVQTAEGALNETHSILQRMRELANQAANDTNVGVDRSEIQKEINALTSEINRIGNTTEFNTQKLLNGGGVDPTSTSSVSSNGLVVPTSLSGGTGATEQLAQGQITMTAGTDGTNYDDKSFTVTIGDRVLTVYTTFTDKVGAGTGGADSSVDTSTNGDTITLNVLRGADDGGTDRAAATADDIALALRTELANIIAADENLKGNYTVDTAGANVTIDAVGLSQNSDGELVGAGTSGIVSFGAGDSGLTVTNKGAIGTNATATIDFSGATTEQLKGTGIVIGEQRIDFYDSADGKYTGSGIGVDLNGARTPEKIVDAIVGALHNNGTPQVDDVFVSKGEDATLLVTARTAGADGNDISVYNNAEVSVSQVYDNSRLDGEGVVSANALADGEHTVTIENVAASVDKGTVTGVTAGQYTVTIAKDSKLSDGVYRLTNTGTVNEVQLQKQDADGAGWSTVEGYESLALTDNSEFTFGDLTISTGTVAGEFAAMAAGNDFLELHIVGNHYTASLTEADGTAGDAVRVASGQTNVELVAANGVGSAVVNIGTITNPDIFEPGDDIKWSFETETAQTQEGLSSGKFSANFQIGANTAQSMTITIDDMRSVALGVSGTVAGGSASAKAENAKFVETANVTNGTDNVEVEYALDVSTHENATAALTVINDAIETMSFRSLRMRPETKNMDPNSKTNPGCSRSLETT
jgi:flagellin